MKHYLDEMPLYVAGELDEKTSKALEDHIAQCESCREELNLWQAMAQTVREEDSRVIAPANAAQIALVKIRKLEDKRLPSWRMPLFSGLRKPLMGAINLLRVQALMVRHDMWPAVAGVMILSVIVALISKQYRVIAFVGPLVAAASLAGMSGPGQDAAYELTASTPTSAWKILLARLSVVSAYNLGISLLASAAMLLIIPADLLGLFILGWLAPMAFLSCLALLLSVWIGTNNAIVLAYGLWLLQYFRISIMFNGTAGLPAWDAFITAYQRFWESPTLLLAVAAAMLTATLFSTRFTDHRLAQYQA